MGSSTVLIGASREDA